MRKDSSRRLGGWLVLGLLSFSGAVLACRVGAAQPPTASPPPSVTRPPATQAASPSPISGPAGDNVYHNSVAGFYVTLPQGWQVAGPYQASPAQGWAHEIYAFGVSPSAEGGPGASMVVVGSADGFSLEAFAAQQCSACPSHPVESTQVGGMPAQRLQVGGGGVPFSVEWTFVQIKGQVVGFSFRDPATLAPLPDVLESVRFE